MEGGLLVGQSLLVFVLYCCIIINPLPPYPLVLPRRQDWWLGLEG